MLKHIHDLKNELKEKGWIQRDASPEVHQPSFLRGDDQMHSWDLSLSKRDLLNPPTAQSRVHQTTLKWLRSKGL